MTAGTRVFVGGVGVLGPGLSGWPAACPVLRGDSEYADGAVVLPAVACLPPAERRRTAAVVRLAIAVGLEAMAHGGFDPAEMATVFTSSGGDSETIHAILSVLATEQREVSPTRFHNSVHNAPSGYWAVACAARAPSTSLCAFDGSFAMGLLDAAVQAAVDERPVTLIAYDLPYPEPLHSVRTIGGVFGVALVLTPRQVAGSLAALTVSLDHEAGEASTIAVPALEALRQRNPAARGLPLLAALAAGQSAEVALGGIDGALLRIAVTPC